MTKTNLQEATDPPSGGQDNNPPSGGPDPSSGGEKPTFRRQPVHLQDVPDPPSGGPRSTFRRTIHLRDAPIHYQKGKRPPSGEQSAFRRSPIHLQEAASMQLREVIKVYVFDALDSQIMSQEPRNTDFGLLHIGGMLAFFSKSVFHNPTAQ